MSDPLHRLARANRTGVFLGALAVGLLGMFLPGLWGALVLFAAVAGLAYLLNRTWAVTPPALRLVRLVILALLAVVAASKIT